MSITCRSAFTAQSASQMVLLWLCGVADGSRNVHVEGKRRRCYLEYPAWLQDRIRSASASAAAAPSAAAGPASSFGCRPRVLRAGGSSAGAAAATSAAAGPTSSFGLTAGTAAGAAAAPSAAAGPAFSFGCRPRALQAGFAAATAAGPAGSGLAGGKRDSTRCVITALASLTRGDQYSGSLHYWEGGHSECELLRDWFWGAVDAFSVTVQEVWLIDPLPVELMNRFVAAPAAAVDRRRATLACNLFYPVLDSSELRAAELNAFSGRTWTLAEVLHRHKEEGQAGQAPRQVGGRSGQSNCAALRHGVV